MISYVEHLPLSVGHLCVFLGKSLFLSGAHLKFRLLKILRCVSSLYILDINPYQITLANIFSQGRHTDVQQTMEDAQHN